MRVPWHLWVIGLFTLAWNAMGAVDYVMTQARYEPYMAQFTDAQRAYFESFPAWVQGSWALAVWLSVAGSLLLLFKSRYAVICLGSALVFMVATFVHNFFLDEIKMSDVVGPGALLFSLLIVFVAVFLWLYARKLRSNGVLK